MSEKILGILELENKPLAFPGNLAGPGTFRFPVKRKTVPGASVRRIISSDRSLADAYVNGARELESEGVAAIISNCGFSAVYQAEVAGAVSVPVALSSLLLVPLVARTLPAGRKVGLITYDTSKLGEDHFLGAGWSSTEIGVAVAGIEGSETWRRLVEAEPAVTPSMVIDDVMAAVKSLLKAEPAVAALVFECAAFPLAAEAARRETGLPVADYVSMANLLVEISPPRSAEGR